MVLNPPTVRFSIPVKGATTARLASIKGIGNNQVTYGGLTSVGPGLAFPGIPGTDLFIFLRDLVYMAESFPGFFTAAYLRSALDKFVTSIGGDVLSPTSPAEYIDSFDIFRYRPGTGSSYLATFDNSAFLVLLAALIYERGDTSVFSAYKIQYEQALAAAPRAPSGCLYSDPDPAFQTTGWGFEDGATSANRGDLGMGTAYYALAYRKLASMATTEGDTVAAALYEAEAASLISGLATLRRTDGFYNTCSFDPQKNVMLTSFVVYFDFTGSPAESLASAQALLNEYNATSDFSGGDNSLGGSISQRGGIRHLVYPAFYAESTVPQGDYQNGAAWLGQWVGWVAYSLSLVDQAKAKELLQSATYEIARMHRITNNGPWEWLNNSSPGAAASSAASGFLAFVSDEAEDHGSATLFGGTGTSATMFFPEGNRAFQYSLFSSQNENVSVQITSVPKINTIGEDIPPVDTYGGTNYETDISMVDEAVVISASLARSNFAAVGGLIKATVTKGAVSSPLTVKVIESPNFPYFESYVPGPPVPVVVDDYSTNKLDSDYYTNGSFTVTGGKLVNTLPIDRQFAIYSALGAFKDGDFEVDIQSSAIQSSKFPGIIARASFDGANYIGAYLGVDSVNVFESLNGAWTPVATTLGVPIANNETANIRMKLTGSVVEIYVNDILTTTTSTNVNGAGYFGPYLASGLTTATVNWDNLTVTETVPLPVVPPGVAVTSPTKGWVFSDPVTDTTNLTIRDSQGYPVAVWASGGFRFAFPDSGLPFTAYGVRTVNPLSVSVTFSDTVVSILPANVSVSINGVTIGVSSVSPGASDSEIIVGLQSPMPNGTGVVSISSAVGPQSQSYSGTLVFLVDFSQTSSEGQPNPTAYDLLRQFLPSAFSGKNWTDLLWALAAGDQTNFNNTKAAFDQAFLHTATGKYLDQRASERGITARIDSYMTDERFRRLVETLDLERVTEHSIWAVLEVMYGPQKTRAYAYAPADQASLPYVGGETVSLLMEGSIEINATFKPTDFASPGAASYSEVAAAINRAMVNQGYKGFAVVEWSSISEKELRIYSEAIGYGGRVEVSGTWVGDNPAFPSALTGKVFYLQRFSSAGTRLFASVEYNDGVLEVRLPHMPIIDAPSGYIEDDLVIGDSFVPASPKEITNGIIKLLESVVAVGNDYSITVNYPNGSSSEEWGG